MSQLSCLLRKIDRDLAQHVHNASDAELHALRLKTDPAYARAVRRAKVTARRKRKAQKRGEK